MTTDIGALLAQIDQRLRAVERASRLSSASLDDAALEVHDDTGSLRALVGQQSDGTTAMNVVNGPPPPQPSAPVAASVLGGVTVSWDGTFTDGAVLPLDWSRTEVHASPSTGFTPSAATLVSTIETAQGGTVVVPTGVDVYVRLMARTTSGTASDPSTEVGPYGPAPVVADAVLDGIIDELALADDAVTAAKIAASAVGTTEISDNAVTTPKIIAGAVETAQLAAEAVNAGKIAAGAVTTAKLDALAVTADKIAANAITAAKIQAGAVETAALAADAITGKTITGGTITGSVLQTDTTGERITINEADANKVLVYDDTGRAVGELSGRGLLLEGTNGALLWLDPDNTYPNLRLTNDDQTNEAVINVVETTAGAADLGLNSGTFTGSSYADMKWRTFFGNDFWAAERLRDSDNGTVIGGRVELENTSGALQYIDTDNPSQTTALNVGANLATVDQGRLWVNSVASASSALLVETPSGHTGALIRLRNDSADRFFVDKDGNASVLGRFAVTPAASALSAIFVNTASGYTGNLLRLQLNATDKFTVNAAGDVAVVGDLTVQGRDTGRGLIGSIIRTSNLTSITTTNVVAMTVPSMVWKTGRAYRVDMTALMSSTTAGTYAVYQLVKGTTAGGTVVRGQIRQVLAGTASVNTHQEFSIVITNSTGADITTALTLTASVAAGTGQLSASSATPASMTVTDIGLAADWPGTPIT